jgi:hypothetical protein
VGDEIGKRGDKDIVSVDLQCYSYTNSSPSQKSGVEAKETPVGDEIGKRGHDDTVSVNLQCYRYILIACLYRKLHTYVSAS